MYSGTPCQENSNKGHRSATCGSYPVCLYSCTIWSIQRDKNKKMSELSLKKKSKNVASVTSIRGWFELRSHHSLPWTQHSFRSDVPCFSPLTWVFNLCSVEVRHDWVKWCKVSSDCGEVPNKEETLLSWSFI